MAQVTLSQAEELLLSLSREEQLSFLARIFKDAEFLEDLEDLVDMRLAKKESDQPIPWEQVKKNLKAKNLL